MVILVYPLSSDPDEIIEEEFEEVDQALSRACELLASGETRAAEIEDQSGQTLVEADQIANLCAARGSAGGPGGGGGSGAPARPPIRRSHRQTVKLTAALFNERGQRFAIVSVRDSVLANTSEADKIWRSAMRLFKQPVLLKGERRNYGDQNLVRAFRNLQLGQITGWREYTFTVG